MGEKEQINTTSSKVFYVDSEKSWENFIIQSKKLGSPVVVHFTATWCIVSVAVNSLFEELARSYPDAKFLLVDVDELMDVAKKMEVKAMPTFIMMRDGVVVDKLVGANPKEIRKRITNFAQPSPIITGSNGPDK